MKERNQIVDILRGIAMLLVVLGHTMTGCTTQAQQSFLYSIVWSLQIPLFILISGYVTRYSRQIKNGADLWGFIKRRTVAYLFPWIVWSLLVKGIIFGQHDFFNIKWLLWYMGLGYWFLVTIWTINMIFGIAIFFAEKTTKKTKLPKTILLPLLFSIGAGILFGIGFYAGFSFFAIKYTLYYIPFFLIGFLFGQYQDAILKNAFGLELKDAVVAISLATWLFIILRCSIFALPDKGWAIGLRAVTSITGCIAVCGLCNSLFAKQLKWREVAIEGDAPLPIQSSDDNESPDKVLSLLKQMGINLFFWAGKRSLEIYLIHGFLLNVLSPATKPCFSSIHGQLLVSANFIITVILCGLAISLIEANTISKRILMR